MLTNKCKHKPGDSCMWCCDKCDQDAHLCQICGTPVGHSEVVCGDKTCKEEYVEEMFS